LTTVVTSVILVHTIDVSPAELYDASNNINFLYYIAPTSSCTKHTYRRHCNILYGILGKKED